MPRGVPRKVTRPEKTTETGQPSLFKEADPSTRLQKIKSALAGIDFSFTIFFTDENGQRIKHYCGSVIQEEA